ncbi:hypothetical protein HF086_002874 [Spodoptera exigua]|uniref:PHD-type domain-containing protein n=1 Tax=Spodoptera exigua TaxID=7107 RepID=A0A922SCD8_SPOEX|nr:hypothetical protein HF086_002874 [Spodoptera exigua]
MTAAVFYDYIANCFHQELTQNNIPFPVILFVDGHKTHITLEVSELCRILQIHLIALYPNATRILQPADVAAFRPIKAGWKKMLREWYIACNYQENLNKESFAPLLKKVVDSCAKKETLINGFRVTGLYPFEADNVDYSKCLSIKKPENDEPTAIMNTTDAEYVLTYSDFCEIVGESIIHKCHTITSLPQVDIDDNFAAIYKLWQKFKAVLEKIMFRQDWNQSLHTDDDNLFAESCAVIDLKEPSEESRMILNECTGELTINNENNENETQNIQVKENEGDSHKKIYPLPINPNKTISVVSNIPFSEYLKQKLPDFPQRQGKRQIERTTFALTSNQYVDKIREKPLKKQEEDAAKEKRKRSREEKKSQKENDVPNKKPKNKTKKTATNKIINSQDESKKLLENKKNRCVTCCDYCLNPITRRVILCSLCNKQFHENCIPLPHRIHIPEDECDSFLCHNCYKESNSTSDDDDDDVINLFKHVNNYK